MTETIYDQNGTITAFQVKRIMRNCSFQVETKNEWIQWVTGDVNRTSLKSINQNQAVQIIRAQEGSTAVNKVTENWATFDNNNKKHKVIISIMYQAQWVIKREKASEIPDLERLSKFLQSEKAPVRKKLKEMDDIELEKTIKALNGIVKSRYK